MNGIDIRGANGVVVDFYLVKKAVQGGLVGVVMEGGVLVTVAWEKVDLVDLRTRQPKIFEAYRNVKDGGEVDLNLRDGVMEAGGVSTKGGKFELVAPGWFEVKAGGMQFALQIPEGSIKGVLLVSKGGDGRSIQFLSRTREIGAWADFLLDRSYAILSYDFPMKFGEDGLPTDHGFLEGGKVGNAIFLALEAFANSAGKPELKEVPIAVYGSEVVGASFAYNFIQMHPKRIVCGFIAKGSFLTRPASAESSLVPILFVFGEYDQIWEAWSAPGDGTQIFREYASLKPNWIYTIEASGNSNETPQLYNFGITFLKKMIDLRTGEDGKLKELDRAEGWVGDAKTLEFSKGGDAEAVLELPKTWLPNGDIAQHWKDFSNGEYPLPGQGGN